MEKIFAKLNYYEMLDVKPDATFFEIRHAYNAALQVYQEDSLISYSFFSQGERKEILDHLEKAYLTLMNEKEKQDYDDELVRLGILNEPIKGTKVKTPVSIFDINREQGKTSALKNSGAELRMKVSENKFIGAILSQQEISGDDLKKIRNELAVPLEQIAKETKIRIDYLVGIEGDNIKALPAAVFLKGFIKSYLKCLYLEPVEEISARCMKRWAHFGEKS